MISYIHSAYQCARHLVGAQEMVAAFGTGHGAFCFMITSQVKRLLSLNWEM